MHIQAAATVFLVLRCDVMWTLYWLCVSEDSIAAGAHTEPSKSTSARHSVGKHGRVQPAP